MMRRFIFLAAAIAFLTNPLNALAHAFLDNAVPKVGSMVSSPPKEITIQFTQQVEAAFSHIRLINPQGQLVEVGHPSTNPGDATKLTVPITGKLTPGDYEVQWDVVSVDTHLTNGHFPFTYRP